ncbi:unnamed protein product [Diatraea saccharalis]|uniref:Uncharacterized protein n=1 Tax=Diatraea saccharalis TaxID=40085 RepID=A0A9N9QTN5_9NEOP|nr:unnamed protein product [Diatraea saccharalis]
MLGFGKLTHINHTIVTCVRVKCLSTCCPPPKKATGCMPGGKSIGKCIPPPGKCGGARPPIPPNPCVPRFHHGTDTWKKYRSLALFVCIPLIIAQAMNVFSHSPPPKGSCRDYEYMRVRTKRFPWGKGNETFFHNEHVNHLPGECEPPSPDCD